MSNLDLHTRNQFERATLSDNTYVKKTTPALRRAIMAYTAIATAVLAIGTWMAVLVFNGWPDLLIVGDLLVVLFGLAYWVWPDRKPGY